MTNRWLRVGEISSELALAVELTDAVVGGSPIGEQQVRVKESDERPIQNRSGYYLFFDLPPQTVTVEVDGGDRYHDESTTVNLDPDGSDTHDPGQAVGITLTPTASYRFPAGMTRVRGTVLNGDSPVSGATVSVDGYSRTVRTTDGGEYFFYFDDVANDDIERKDPKPDDPSNVVSRYFKPDGSHPTFEVDGPPGQFHQSVKVEVGKLTKANLTY